MTISLKSVFEKARVAEMLILSAFVAFEQPHVMHEIMEGHNNPDHTERRVEYRRYIEQGLQYAVSKNIKASGYLVAEHHDDVIHPDELSIIRDFPNLDTTRIPSDLKFS